MAVAFDKTVSVQGNRVTSSTTPVIAPAGANLWLGCFVILEQGNSVSAGTPPVKNATAFSLVRADEDVTSGQRIELWELTAPSTASETVVVTYTGQTQEDVVVGLISTNGVNQTTPRQGTVVGTGSDQDATATITSAAGNLVLAGVSTEPGMTLTVGTGTTDAWTNIDGGKAPMSSGGYEAGVASTVINWSIDVTSMWRILAVSLAAAAAAPAGYGKLLASERNRLVRVA